MSRPCRHTGCPNIVTSRSQKGYCDTHAQYRTNWNKRDKRLTTSARGYGSEWRKLRQIVLKRDHYLCQCDDCRRTNRINAAHDVDHIIPKAQGGTDDLSNLRAISTECHRLKTAKKDSKNQ